LGREIDQERRGLDQVFNLKKEEAGELLSRRDSGRDTLLKDRTEFGRA